MKSRPDREPEVLERRARGEEARRARDAFVATPAFTLVTDDDTNMHETTAPTPTLRVKRPPRTTNINKYWFNPPWIAENERPDVDHGEFQSPVWLAVEMTMRSDRERDRDVEANETGTPRHARHAAAEPETGQLRSMLAMVNGAKHAASPVRPVTYIHASAPCFKPSATSRYHDLPPRPARQARKFVRFISSNLGKVSVNHN